MWGIDMLFVVGGNGGNAGAAAIQAQCEKDEVVCNVVGVPKSIDNDILVVCTLPTLHCYWHPGRLHSEPSTASTSLSLHATVATEVMEHLGHLFFTPRCVLDIKYWIALHCSLVTSARPVHSWGYSANSHRLPLHCIPPTATLLQRVHAVHNQLSVLGLTQHWVHAFLGLRCKCTRPSFALHSPAATGFASQHTCSALTSSTAIGFASQHASNALTCLTATSFASQRACIAD